MRLCITEKNRKSRERSISKKAAKWRCKCSPSSSSSSSSFSCSLSLTQTLVIVQVPLSLTEGNTKHQKEVERENQIKLKRRERECQTAIPGMETLLGRIRTIGTYQIQCYAVESFELYIKDNAIQEVLKYWVVIQRGQSYLIGRRCLFSLGWRPF